MKTASETSGTILNTPIFEVRGSQKKKRKRKGTKNFFEEIIVENLSSMKRK